MNFLFNFLCLSQEIETLGENGGASSCLAMLKGKL